jgi:hypothetical protein
MDALLVCAQRGDASTKTPNTPAIADAATTLHPLIADEAAVLIVLVNGEATLRSITMNSSFERPWGFECPIQSETAARTADINNLVGRMQDLYVRILAPAQLV